ncbi:condensation domain-containing protein [Chitinophaga filiformis]|uniref:Condensation domain-containing protein n=1 Tax=Chitinophaga filiformis TaxID=104663 RepID=A0A1G7XB93_CHIFI|nr:condensation domain-containing protein [Chitinophaga filiformis]SDG81391.1 Condensation domain-containing protein [Chitinophaga filiformis]
MKRKLLLPERIMLGDGATPFNGVFVVRINGTLAPESLYNALSKVQAKHPLLRAGIVQDKKGTPYFTIPEVYRAIPLSIKDRITAEDWQQETKAAWASVFDIPNGPLIRMVWLKGSQQSELLLAFHHCMCDGGGGLMLVREILAVLDDPDYDIGIHQTFTTLEDIVPKHILTGTRQVLKAKLKGAFIRGVLTLLSAFTSTRNKQPVSREDDYLVHWKLDQQTSSALFQHCSMQMVTVNTALCVAFLQAFQLVRGEKAMNKITCPVDIRKFIPEIKKDVIFSFGLSLELSINNDPAIAFWERVQQLQAISSEKISKMDPYDFMLPFEHAHGGIKHMRKFLTYGKPVYDLMFSNMGKLDVRDKYHSFEVDTIFSPTVVGPFANPTTIITSTYKGQIDFSFVSNHAVLDHRDALAIKELAMKLLLEDLHVAAPAPALSSII